MKRSAIKVDPEKVRAFVQRGRERAAEKARERPRKPLVRRRREKPVEGPLSASEWWEQVYRLAGGRCAVTRAIANSKWDRRFERHHVIPKSLLRRRGLHRKVYDPRNGMLVHRDVHADHTSRAHPIPRRCVSAEAWAFASECGPWAEAYLERMYG